MESVRAIIQHAINDTSSGFFLNTYHLASE
jgi:hypothetical protein